MGRKYEFVTSEKTQKGMIHKGIKGTIKRDGQLWEAFDSYKDKNRARESIKFLRDRGFHARLIFNMAWKSWCVYYRK